MSYYHDGRDVLEAAYPTCTSFTHYHARPTLTGLKRRQCGLAMVIDLHSESALQRFRLLCYSLEDSVTWTPFRFDVYDFAGLESVFGELSRFGSIVGAGELFWISEGRIVAAMTDDYNAADIDAMMAKLAIR